MKLSHLNRDKAAAKVGHPDLLGTSVAGFDLENYGHRHGRQADFWVCLRSCGGSGDLFGVNRLDRWEACEVAGVEGKDALDAVDLH